LKQNSMHDINQLRQTHAKENAGTSITLDSLPSNTAHSDGTVSTYVTLHTSLGSTAKVFLHGAHVTSFQDAEGHELMFLSKKAHYNNEESIRGGIPICWPQFADEGPLPMHGLVHSTEWTLKETSVDGHPRAVFTLTDSEDSRKKWPHSFRLTYTVEIVAGDQKKERLNLNLKVENLGDKAFSWTGALHTYYHVNDLTNTTITGLKGVTYIDKTKKKEKFEEKRENINFEGEADKVFLGGAKNSVALKDGSDSSVHYRLEFTGFSDVVLWNPWTEKAKEIPDFDSEEWRKMLCLEATQLSQPVQVEANEQWSGSYSIGRA